MVGVREDNWDDPRFGDRWCRVVGVIINARDGEGSKTSRRRGISRPMEWNDVDDGGNAAGLQDGGLLVLVLVLQDSETPCEFMHNGRPSILVTGAPAATLPLI